MTRWRNVLTAAALGIGFGVQASFAVVWTRIPMPYFYAYGPAAGQTQPGPYGPWQFLFPGTVTTPIPDQLGCRWNAPAGAPYHAPPYWPPPYWYAPPYSGGIDELSGPILRGYGVVGATTHDPPASVGTRGMEFKAKIPAASWSNGTQQIMAMYYASDNCYSGDIEYGFAHYYQTGTTQFYFYNYSNCSNQCFLVGSSPPNPTSPPPSIPVSQCSAAINLPNLPANDNGDYNYLYASTVYYDPPSGHYRFAVAIVDQVTNATFWACMVDPLETPNFQTPNYPSAAKCNPQPSDYVNYSCTVDGQPEAYPIGDLYYTRFGAVTGGVVNPANTPIAPATAVIINQVNIVEYPN